MFYTIIVNEFKNSFSTIIYDLKLTSLTLSSFNNNELISWVGGNCSIIFTSPFSPANKTNSWFESGNCLIGSKIEGISFGTY